MRLFDPSKVTDTNICVREDPCSQAQSDPYFCYYNRFDSCCARPRSAPRPAYYNYGRPAYPNYGRPAYSYYGR